MGGTRGVCRGNNTKFNQTKTVNVYLSIKNKVKLYKTLIRSVLAYGYETWVLSKSDEAILGVFERKFFRAIFGPPNYNGEWRIKYSDELYALCKENDIVTYIEINRLRWAGGGAERYTKSPYCSSRRKKAKGQTKIKMGGRRDG
jgi:hypothetical protein